MIKHTTSGQLFGYRTEIGKNKDKCAGGACSSASHIVYQIVKIVMEIKRLLEDTTLYIVHYDAHSTCGTERNRGQPSADLVNKRLSQAWKLAKCEVYLGGYSLDTDNPKAPMAGALSRRY
jgi:hypothetical protein